MKNKAFTATHRGNIVKAIAGTTYVSCVFLFSIAADGAERRELHRGHVPAVVKHLQPVGPIPASQNLNLAIGLPLSNQGALTNWIQQIYDPASPYYRHYLTPEQFTERFGPTEKEYEAVVAFVRSNGFKVTVVHSNRMLLDVTASMADIERAFQVTMRVFQ